MRSYLKYVVAALVFAAYVAHKLSQVSFPL